MTHEPTPEAVNNRTYILKSKQGLFQAEFDERVPRDDAQRILDRHEAIYLVEAGKGTIKFVGER